MVRHLVQHRRGKVQRVDGKRPGAGALSNGLETGPSIGAQSGPRLGRLVPVIHRRDPRAAGVPVQRLTQRRVGGACGLPVQAGAHRQARFLNRQLSLPVSTISQWCVRRSSNAVVILASPNTLGHSPKARLVVTITEVCS